MIGVCVSTWMLVRRAWACLSASVRGRERKPENVPDREPTGGWSKNMGNMGFFGGKIWGKYGNFRRFLQENMGNMGILKRLSTIAMGRSAASHSSFTLPMTAAISFGSN